MLVISNHNSFRVLFDKLLPYLDLKKIYYILALEMASPGNKYCLNCIGTLSFSIAFGTRLQQRKTQKIPPRFSEIFPNGRQF